MKYSFLGLVLALILSTPGHAQEMRAYALYDSSGAALSFEEWVERADHSDVILFGEMHDNPINHWLQYELAQALYARDSSLSIAMEMLERDDQKAVDQFLKGALDYRALDTTARLWPNFKTDYLPLLEMAKRRQLPVVASNAPRRLASLVYKQGFAALDSLSDSVKTWLPPLPIDYDPQLPGYQKMLEMAHGHGGENLPKAQALKDATMAHWILNDLPENGKLLHLNGDYHSANFEGIYWYLKRERPELNILTISTVEKENVSPPDSTERSRADVLLIIDSDVTRSH